MRGQTGRFQFSIAHWPSVYACENAPRGVQIESAQWYAISDTLHRDLLVIITCKPWQNIGRNAVLGHRLTGISIGCSISNRGMDVLETIV